MYLLTLIPSLKPKQLLILSKGGEKRVYSTL